MSPTVIIFVIAETLIAFALLAGLFYFITVKLKKQIGNEKSKLKSSLKQLKNERLPETTRTKIKTYFNEQIELTNKKIKNCENDKLSDQNLQLLEMRENILNFESKVVSSHALDEGFWDNIFDEYQSARQEPGIDTNEISDDDQCTIFEEIPAQAEENVSLSLDSDQDNIDEKSAELERLHNVVGNQFESIDNLKRHIQEIEDEEPDFSDYPFVIEMKARLTEMEMEQEQMAMCVQVMESENERLTHILKQYEEGNEAGVQTDSLEQIRGDSTAVKTISEKLRKADNMIRDLIHSSKNQLILIMSLESENESLKTHDSLGEKHKELTEDIKEAEQMTKKLTQSNKEHEQCIIILESKVESLQQSLSEKGGQNDNISEGGQPGSSGHGSDKNKDDLYAKMAELDLLQADYDSMKQKYLKLFQQSKAS